MSGALDLMMGGVTTGGGGGSVTPATWANIFGLGVGFNGAQKLAVTGIVALSCTITGTGGLETVRNGVIDPYGGPFAVDNGDTVGFGVTAGGSNVAGSVTVTNSGTVVGSFTYSVHKSDGDE